MRFAVMGAGALGSYIGARLAEAGHEVALIARGAHLEALRREGLKVRGPYGDHDLRLPASDQPEEAGRVDVVLFLVKSYDTVAAARAIKPLTDAGALVLSLQNGLDNPERLAAELGTDRVLAGTAAIEAVRAEPGFVRQLGQQNQIRLGAWDRAPVERAGAVAEALAEAGFDAAYTDDVRHALWSKVVALGSLGAMNCLLRERTVAIGESPEATAALGTLVREIHAAAAADNVDLGPVPPDRAEQMLRGVSPEHKTSMLRDLERGRRLEVDAIQGAILRVAEARGVPAPSLRLAYACLKFFDEQAARRRGANG